ncbi:hypothetical protein V8E36_000753 [Tilletia maclaganii]
MRESNFSNPALDRACVCITSSVYDRRAIDSTSTLPLINSLNHLASLTSTSPRIREMVTLDGGLERLIQILQRIPPAPSPDKPATTQLIRSIWKWSLAFQCAVNIGVRGTEHVRIRVVDAGMVPITVNVLESYLAALDQVVGQDRATRHAEKYAAVAAAASSTSVSQSSSSSSVNSTTRGPIEARTASTRDVSPSAAAASSSSSSSSSSTTLMQESTDSVTSADHAQSRRRHHGHSRQHSSRHSSSTHDAQHRHTSAAQSEDDAASSSMDESASSSSSIAASRRNAMVDGLPASHTPSLEQPNIGISQATSSSSRPLPAIIYREEEVLLSLQLLAYVSKYPHVRELFHTAEVVEGSMPEWYSIVASAAMSGGGSSPEADAEATQLTAELLSKYATRTESWDPAGPQRKTVFSIAERFTSKGASARSATKYYSRLANEIQEWASVIMRNACRKDDTRGGVRQCANMLCGRWEAFPREFAKCRRCRKAKYCSKQCQSKGWAMGHRYWCNSVKGEEACDEAQLGKSGDKYVGAGSRAGAGTGAASTAPPSSAAAEANSLPTTAAASPVPPPSMTGVAATIDEVEIFGLEHHGHGGPGTGRGGVPTDMMATPTALQPHALPPPHFRPTHSHSHSAWHSHHHQRSHSEGEEATPRIRAMADGGLISDGEEPMELDET